MILRRILPAISLCLIVLMASAAGASAQTKSLKLYYLHTGERAEITYKKNGRYLASGLKKINWHLRDWRRNEPTKMDPQLLDLIWEAYRQSGSRKYIHVISGYRSPASNNMLRKRGRGVAKSSQHTKGKALDFFLPDVKLSKLREIGLKMGVGGVGYYPKSGSPFVHFDTGNVRHWPRMTRSQLVRVFPKGDTMHVPTDGKPLARYKQAVAAYKSKKSKGTLVPESSKGGLNFFQRLAANTRDDEEDDNTNAAAPAPRAVATRVAPKPEQQAPEETAPQFASLPASVPVPTLAPRGLAAQTGAELTVAANEPAKPSQPESIETEAVLARDETETLPENETGSDTLIENAEAALASLVVPVPARRPQFNLPDESGPSEPDSTLALVETPSARDASGNASDGVQIAALTPEEIEDLRLRVRSTIGASSLASPELTRPIPAASVGETGSIPVPAPRNSETASVSASTPVEVASLEPATDSSLDNVTPTTQEPVTPEPVTLEPVGLEPGVKTSGEFATPVPSPKTPEIEIASVDTEVEEKPETGLALANLPVPQKRPEVAPVPTAVEPVRDTQVAALKNEPTTSPASLAPRTISLDRFSAPQQNSAVIGKFALSAETTIQDLADVRAPAYGRNVIRELPKTIVVQGFNLQPFGPGRNNFKGKAVNAMRFSSIAVR